MSSRAGNATAAAGVITTDAGNTDPLTKANARMDAGVSRFYRNVTLARVFAQMDQAMRVKEQRPSPTA
jgi:hypothetical protein